MDGNMSQGGMIPGGALYGGLDLQGSMRAHYQPQNLLNMQQQQQQLQVNPRQGSLSIHEGFPLTMGTMHNTDQIMPVTERGKSSLSDEEDPSLNDESCDGHIDAKGKKDSPWQRVKWTDKMVRLLITAVSYLVEDGASDCPGIMRRKFTVLQKKGKWKSISKVMAERSFHVSPQQCEDKFNDLNKRYKKLNDIIGRGTSCQVVENPALLDTLEYLSEKEKDDVRKILNSKHLFYEEMCSYHNGNRLHLPHDLALQRSLRIALKSRDDHDDDVRRPYLDGDENDDEDDDFDENHQAAHGRIFGTIGGSSVKRSRQGPAHEDICFGNSLNPQDGQKSSYPQFQISQPETNPESSNNPWLQKQWVKNRAVKIEEQKLQIQTEMLELEKQRFKWERFSKKKDHELELMRMENERLKLENERMSLELKRNELNAEFK
ncbi:hypothetical protein ACFE04_015949 [Oxalis oulophora]